MLSQAQIESFYLKARKADPKEMDDLLRQTPGITQADIYAFIFNRIQFNSPKISDILSSLSTVLALYQHPPRHALARFLQQNEADVSSRKTNYQVMFNTLKRWGEYSETPPLDAFIVGLQNDIAVVYHAITRLKNYSFIGFEMTIATIRSCHQNVTGGTAWRYQDFCENYAAYLVSMRALAEKDVNQRNHFPCKLLHIAAHDGLVEFGKLLIEHGADINALDQTGQTALTHAVAHKHRDFVELLLKQPTIDLCIRSKNDVTPEKLAKPSLVAWGNKDPIHQLLRQASIRQFFREARGVSGDAIVKLLEVHKDSYITLKDICEQMYLLFQSNEDPEARKILITEMRHLIIELPFGSEEEKERVLKPLKDWEDCLMHLTRSIDLGVASHTAKPTRLINLEQYLQDRKNQQNPLVTADRDERYLENNLRL
jgi:ankyrin repeat protein